MCKCMRAHEGCNFVRGPQTHEGSPISTESPKVYMYDTGTEDLLLLATAKSEKRKAWHYYN